MCSGPLAGRYDSLDYVSGLETERLLLPHEIPTRKAELVEASALVRAAAGRLDRKRRHVPADEVFDFANAGRIQRVRLRDAKPRTVPLRSTATTIRDWQASSLERPEECPPCRVYGSGVLEWGFELRLDPSQNFRLLRQEHFYWLSALLLIAGNARADEI